MHVLVRSKRGQRVFRPCDRTQDLNGISIRKSTQGVQRGAKVTKKSPLNSVSLFECFASGVGTVRRLVTACQRALRAS